MFTDENYLRSPNYIFEDKINDSWNENEGELDDDLNSNFLNNNSKVVDFDEESFQNENEENEETRANSNQHELSNNKLPVKEIDVDMNKTKTKIIVLRIKNGRLDYLYKKFLIYTFEKIRNFLNKNNPKPFKRINFELDIKYETLKRYLEISIEEVFIENIKKQNEIIDKKKKDEQKTKIAKKTKKKKVIEPLIDFSKKHSDESRRVLEMNLRAFIDKYENEINDEYDDYFKNEFMENYTNTESFIRYKTIRKLINNIYNIEVTEENE